MNAAGWKVLSEILDLVGKVWWDYCENQLWQFAFSYKMIISSIVTLPGFTTASQRGLSWNILRMKKGFGWKQRGQFFASEISYVYSMWRLNPQRKKHPYFPPVNSLPEYGEYHPLSHTRTARFLRLWTSAWLENESKTSGISWAPRGHAEVASEAIHIPKMCGLYHAGLGMLFVVQNSALSLFYLSWPFQPLSLFERGRFL